MTSYNLFSRFKIQAIACVFAASLLAAPVVVLPERYKDVEVIVKNSSVFKALVAKNKKLVAQLQTEATTRSEFEKRVGEDMQSAAAELEKYRATQAAAHKGIWSSVTGTVFGLLNIGVMFFTNPFGYMMKTLMSIVEGLIAIVVLFFLGKFAWRHRNFFKKQPPKQ